MRILLVLTMAPLIASAALAQAPSAPGQQKNNAAQPQAQQIQRQVRKNLQEAGFTDIQMMPSSFLVRAKDKSGNTVMMVINPDSITAVTTFEQNRKSTTGQGNGGPQQGGTNSAPPSAK